MSASESGISCFGLWEKLEETTNGVHHDVSRCALPEIPGYTIHRMLGRGGMGAIYEASRNNDAGEHVALKTVPAAAFQTISRSIRKRFDREAQILLTFRHASFVPILDCGHYESGFQRMPYFTMPLLECGDLARVLQSSPIESRDELKHWINRLQILLEGLAEAHAKGLVHRDIKPKNIFVGKDGALLLGDFGLAKTLHEDSDLTSTIGHLGTTPYAPPEQFLSAKLVDGRADIYAIGVILYQFICFGLRPFSPDDESEDNSSETSSIALWQRSTDRVAPVPSSRRRSLSDPSLDYIVKKCLAYYPGNRYSTVKHLVADLQAWLEGKTVRGTLAERIQEHLLQPILKRFALVSTAAFLLITAVGLATLHKFAALNEKVESLNSDVQYGQHKLHSELRRQLEDILPKLQGENQDYVVRRSPDPASEFKNSNKRAEEIVQELGFDASPDFWERHNQWVVMRNSKPAEFSADYVSHLEEVIDFTESNLLIARSSDDQSTLETAYSDLLRSLRLYARVAWIIREEDPHIELRGLIDSRRITVNTARSLERLRKDLNPVVSAATERHIQLLTLELEIKQPELSPLQVVDICQRRSADYSEAQLLLDGCQDLHVWYQGWYIYEHYYQAALASDLPAAERRPIVDGWYALTESTPAPNRDLNITYKIDLYEVADRRADVLRDMGRIAEARDIYEQNWSGVENLRAEYPSQHRVWHLSEQILSSLIKTTEIDPNLTLQKDYLERERNLYRDRLSRAAANPGFLDQESQMGCKLNLVGSLIRALELAGTDQVPDSALLDESLSHLRDLHLGGMDKKKVASLVEKLKSLQFETTGWPICIGTNY